MEDFKEKKEYFINSEVLYPIVYRFNILNNILRQVENNYAHFKVLELEEIYYVSGGRIS